MFDDGQDEAANTQNFEWVNRRSARRPNLRLLSDEPASSWSVWRGVKRIFGMVSLIGDGSTARARQYFRDTGRIDGTDANALRVLEENIDRVRRESSWQFNELNNRLKELLLAPPIPTGHTPDIMPSGVAFSAGTLKQGRTSSQRLSEEGLKETIPRVPELDELYPDRQEGNQISVAMGYNARRPSVHRHSHQKPAGPSASITALVEQEEAPVRPRMASRKHKPARTPEEVVVQSTLGHPPSPPLAPSPPRQLSVPPELVSLPHSRMGTPSSHSSPSSSSLPSRQQSPIPPQPSPPPQTSGQPSPPPRGAQKAVPTQPGSWTQRPAMADAEHAAGDDGTTMLAGKKNRPMSINLKNQVVRQVIDELWVANLDQTTHSLPSPSQGDIALFATLWRRTPANLIPLLLPPIPERLSPTVFRFCRGRHRDEGVIDPCAMWDLAMARKLVDEHLIPKLKTMVVELDDWTMDERKSHERKELVKAVIRRVYVLHRQADMHDDDIRLRNEIQKPISSRDRLHNKRCQIAKADPQFKHMLAMLRQIGPGGMSSDEDDGQDGSIRRIIHEHPWRHRSITLALRALDARNLAQGGRLLKRGNRGNKSFVRVIPPLARASSRVVHTLEALVAAVPQGLPGNFYDMRKLETWRDNLPEEEKVPLILKDFLQATKADAQCVAIPQLAET